METQAISAPADRPTREAPKRQVGYGLPCAKCHKYFPADLEVCPICKGRERVSPVVAPRIPKPVKSETSVAPSSTNVALKQEVKESTKSESSTLVPPIEIKVKEPLDHKESITTPVVAEIPAAPEPASVSLVSTQTEKETPKLESLTSAPPAEIKVNNQPLDLKESIPTPVLAEIPAAVEPAPAGFVPVETAKESPKLESPAFAAPVEIKPLNQKESIRIPMVAEIPATVELAGASLVSTQKKKQKKSPRSESPAVTSLNDQSSSDQPNQEKPIATPALVEAQTSDPVPAAIASTSAAEELPTEREAPATALPIQPNIEEQRRDKINQALRIVIPMLVEAQASEPASVPAKQKILDREKKEKAAEVSETPMFASEVKIVDAKIVEVEIAEVKMVESPAVSDQASHRPSKEKSKAIDKGSDAPPKPANVSAPVVVHVNLGELQLGQLRAPKSTPERAPVPAQPKEIERTEPKTGRADISSDVNASESPAIVSGRKFDLVTFALSVVVLACAVLLITLVALRLMPHHAPEPVRRAKPAYSIAPATADQNTNALIPTPPPTAAASGNSASSDSSPVVAPAAVPAQSPTASASNLSSSPGSERVLALSPGLAEGNLLYRVEPDYPEEARRQGVQGPVVLDLHISKDGLVQGVDLVSGQPLLVQAATAAVKQWRFRTRYVNGNEVEMQARITLHFALPTP
jgi:TonB family protein